MEPCWAGWLLADSRFKRKIKQIIGECLSLLWSHGSASLKHIPSKYFLINLRLGMWTRANTNLAKPAEFGRALFISFLDVSWTMYSTYTNLARHHNRWHIINCICWWWWPPISNAICTYAILLPHIFIMNYTLLNLYENNQRDHKITLSMIRGKGKLSCNS